MNVGYYENQTTFTQKIKLQNHLDSVNVLISYMASTKTIVNRFIFKVFSCS